MEVARVTPRLDGSAQGARAIWSLQVQPFKDTEADQADEDQINRDNEIKQPRHDQDQYARDQGNDGGHMRSGDGHLKFLLTS